MGMKAHAFHSLLCQDIGQFNYIFHNDQIFIPGHVKVIGCNEKCWGQFVRKLMKSESTRARSSPEPIFEILKRRPFISSACDLFPLQTLISLLLCSSCIQPWSLFPGESSLWQSSLQTGVWLARKEPDISTKSSGSSDGILDRRGAREIRVWGGKSVSWRTPVDQTYLSQ